MLPLSILRDQIATLDDGQGIRLSVSTLDEKCGAVFRLNGSESQTLRWALQVNDVEGIKEDLAAARKDVCALEIERDALKERVAEMTKGEAVAWAFTRPDDGRVCGISIARGDVFTVPLFLSNATELQTLLDREKRMREETRLDLGKAQARVDELQVANESLQVDRVAWRDTAASRLDRIQALVDGEKLTKDALAAAERQCEHLRIIGSSLGTRAEAAEARVKVLEGSAEPVAWVRLRQNGTVYYYSDEKAAPADVPVYLHPPRPAGEPVAWRVVHSNGYTVFAKEQNAVAAYPDCTITPLYEAPPPPAAIGVTEDAFVATWKSDHRPGERAIHPVIQRRAEDAEAKLPGAKGYESRVMRLVPIGAPTVDVSAIRTVIADLRECFPTQTGEQSAQILLTAIGEP